jgi:hypothetical protein
MKFIDRLKRIPSTYRSLTGLTLAQFNPLLKEVEIAHANRRAKQSTRSARQRRPGGGRKPKLDRAESLLLTLIDYRTYITLEFLGFLFGIDKGTACRVVPKTSLLLTGIFRIPERKVRINEDELRTSFIDGTERPIHRPKRKQRRSYSGKKKRHTRKTQVIVVRKKPKGTTEGEPKPKQKVRVVVVSRSREGRVHDKNVFDESRTVIPPGVEASGDTGYQGTPLRTPKKKPRKGILTKAEKAANRAFSKQRIVVEHAIGKMKIWRIAAERFRNPLRKHTMVMKNVAGLHNLMFADSPE